MIVKHCKKHGKLTKTQVYFWSNGIICKQCRRLYHKKYMKNPANYAAHVERSVAFRQQDIEKLGRGYLKSLAANYYDKPYAKVTDKMIAETRKRVVKHRKQKMKSARMREGK